MLLCHSMWLKSPAPRPSRQTVRRTRLRLWSPAPQSWRVFRCSSGRTIGVSQAAVSVAWPACGRRGVAHPRYVDPPARFALPDFRVARSKQRMFYSWSWLCQGSPNLAQMQRSSPPPRRSAAEVSNLLHHLLLIYSLGRLVQHS